MKHSTYAGAGHDDYHRKGDGSVDHPFTPAPQGETAAPRPGGDGVRDADLEAIAARLRAAQVVTTQPKGWNILYAADVDTLMAEVGLQERRAQKAEAQLAALEAEHAALLEAVTEFWNNAVEDHGKVIADKDVAEKLVSVFEALTEERP